MQHINYEQMNCVLFAELLIELNDLDISTTLIPMKSYIGRYLMIDGREI